MKTNPTGTYFVSSPAPCRRVFTLPGPSVTVNTTRRFCARPSFVALSAIGRSSS